MTKDEALNVAGQCRATASHPLTYNISVDGGSGLLHELLIDAAKVIEALAQPEQKRPQNCGTGYCSCVECVMEPKQEPAAWMVYTQDGQSVYVTDNPIDIQENQRALPMYTTPPQRTWVGLTKEEIKAFDTWHDNREEEKGWVAPSEIVAYLDTKFKEKNT